MTQERKRSIAQTYGNGRSDCSSSRHSRLVRGLRQDDGLMFQDYCYICVMWGGSIDWRFRVAGRAVADGYTLRIRKRLSNGV